MTAPAGSVLVFRVELVSPLPPELVFTDEYAERAEKMLLANLELAGYLVRAVHADRIDPA